MTRFATFTLAVLVPVVWLATTERGTPGVKPKGDGVMKMAGPTKAVCVIQPLKLGKGKVHGVVYFTQKGDMVHVTGKISGLTPGLHGFHVHEFGDLTKDDGLSTGGHFNPEGLPHGGPKSDKRHVGDLGNIKADESGTAVIDMKDKLLSLHGKHSIIGRGLIVHEKEDDEKTQPTGDAGGRVGGGVIGVASMPAMKKK
jgi:Cu-Zn family superoxide dismutase